MMSEREEMTFVTKETTSPMAAEMTTTIAPSEFLDDDTADETVTEAVTNEILDESTTSKTTVTRPRAISVTDILVPTVTTVPSLLDESEVTTKMVPEMVSEMVPTTDY